MPVKPGTRVGPYEIVSLLGAGGMGEVYRGIDTRLDRTVAVKLLPEHFGSDPTLRQRFEYEARTVAALTHPHLCTLYDIGELDGRPYLAMELLEGHPLSQRMRGPVVQLGQLIEWGMQVADALAATHAKAIVHRDIKPANIFITTGGRAKVLDFGIAKPSRAPGEEPDHPTILQAPITTDGLTMGTVAYMSPEQAYGEDLDGRTDLFSLGVVLYQLASGALPFTGNTSAAVVDAMLHRDPTPPGRLNAAVPAELDRIIMKLLEKDRRLRYQTASDLQADLARLKRDSDAHPVVRKTRRSRPKAAQGLRIIHPWEAVARDGREFATRGTGIMYWFRVPLGGICHPEGFRAALEPALDNPRISKIRFILDRASPAVNEAWDALVLPLVEAWTERSNRELTLERVDDGGQVLDAQEGSPVLTWVTTDLSEECCPSFKLLVDDPDMDERGSWDAQVFLATVTRTVRLGDGARRSIRVPDTILRVRSSEDESLLHALARIATQWDLL